MLEEDRLALLEREKRRTREPELKWRYFVSWSLYARANNKLFSQRKEYNIIHTKLNNILSIEKYGKGILDKRIQIGEFRYMAEAKHAAHEHWRENGYE